VSKIKNYITDITDEKGKILSIFLTSGFPYKDKFVDLSLKSLDAGADMLEIGFPFSDPLADGPSIQYSSKVALENGVNLARTFEYVQGIRKETNKPLILMGYANPVLSYGIENFSSSCKHTGVDGVIIPDIPLEEFEGFFHKNFDDIDKIFLITPTTPDERIRQIDEKSSGFVYCVSVSGTTGARDNYDNLQYIKRSGTLLNKNKMLVGFGVSSCNTAKAYAESSDGVIVGSAIVDLLMNDTSHFEKTLTFIAELRKVLPYIQN